MKLGGDSNTLLTIILTYAQLEPPVVSAAILGTQALKLKNKF
jgi:hypothetical protein